MKRADTSSLRSHNSLILLHLLRRLQPASARTLTDLTGMQASTVSRLLRKLSGQGLVVSRGVMDSVGNSGRPAELWGLNPEYGASIGLYLASNLVAGVAVDLNGRILDTCVIPYRDPESQRSAGIIGLLRQAMERLRASDRMQAHRLLGVGIAAMGLVDRASNSIRYFDERIELAELTDSVGVPLYIENDANVAARGESMHQRLAGVRDAVVLYAHEGIGAGLILNGVLHTGFNGAAGEVGYRGCQLVSNPLDDDNGEVIGRFYTGISSIINLLNPEVVLLTGDLDTLSEEIIATLRRKIGQNTNPVARQARLIVAPCDPMDIATHIATIVLDEEVFSMEDLIVARGPERLVEAAR